MQCHVAVQESEPRYPTREEILISIVQSDQVRGQFTNDRRYESNDSREIENGSFSFNMLRWLDVEPIVGDLPQKLFFSGGEGLQTISITMLTQGYACFI